MIKLANNFSILDYSLSHSKFLFRSTQGLKNIDIHFYGVIYVDLPLTFSCLSIDFASEIDTANIKERVNMPDLLRCYDILSEDGSHFYISCGKVEVYSNSLNTLETSLTDKGLESSVMIYSM